MTVALDSNILIYAEGHGDVARCSRARELIRRLPPQEVVLPAQAFGEMFAILVRKAGFSKQAASQRVRGWSDGYAVAPTSAAALHGAVELAARHALQIWDSIILEATSEFRCQLLLSEDMHHGFHWKGVTIVNPFAEVEHPLFAALLQG